jgi:hypothetical protein
MSRRDNGTDRAQRRAGLCGSEGVETMYKQERESLRIAVVVISWAGREFGIQTVGIASKASCKANPR